MKVSIIIAGLAATTAVAAPFTITTPEGSPDNTTSFIPYTQDQALNLTSLRRHASSGTNLDPQSEDDDEEEASEKGGFLSGIFKKIAVKAGLDDKVRTFIQENEPYQDWRNNVPARVQGLEKLNPPGVKTDWLGENKTIVKRGFVLTFDDYVWNTRDQVHPVKQVGDRVTEPGDAEDAEPEEESERRGW